jgi:sulfate/thiosulfate transport system permease protein
MAVAGVLHGRIDARRYEANAATRESPWVRRLILGTALSFFALFLLMPLIAVFAEALRKGWLTYVTALSDPDALAAVRLTLADRRPSRCRSIWCSASRRPGRSPSSSFAASAF